ncbi:MAG: integration host factor subunit beta [Gemmatimonadetes bacterium]|nr:integration host factor subunit beta [Gemmatimonadota bacterium]
MTKADIVDQIAEAIGLTKTDTAAVVEGFLTSVVSALQKGEHIEIRGFGTFKVVTRASRTGRNPKTGEVVRIPERPVPVFKPSRELRSGVEGEDA